MKKEIIGIIVIVILGGILLSVGIFGVILFRSQERHKLELARHLVKAHSFESLTLYKIQITPNEIIREDELHSIQHLTWERKIIRRLFSSLSWRQNERIWKNGWLAIVEFDDGSHKQLVMDPAGYFKIVGDNGHYQISSSLRAEFSKMMGEICSGGIRERGED